VARRRVGAEDAGAPNVPVEESVMRHYCTLFDRAYLAKGLALHDSLMRHSSEEFTLYILAMDSATCAILYQLNLPNVRVLPLHVFERELHLAEVKASRTYPEYCWTAASQLIEYVMRWHGDDVTYLDADLYFFSDPKVMFNELGARSMAIVPHRLIPEKAHLAVNGKFNVGWVTIRNTETGRQCIARWAAQCRERCSSAIGCGDQKYLDEWPDLYGEECGVIQNIGANVAPWNVGNWNVTEGPLVDGAPVVFYHFHEFAELEDGSIRFCNYRLGVGETALIYKPYCEAYDAAKVLIAYAECSIAHQRSLMELQSERA
jgi:hypothetical protein